jgi:hypothetical protein
MAPSLRTVGLLVLRELMLVGRVVTQDSFIYVSFGLMMLVRNRTVGGNRCQQGQQRTVSVVRCNVSRRSQVRFLTACVIARRVWALVSVQRRFIGSLSACCKCLGPERCSVID